MSTTFENLNSVNLKLLTTFAMVATHRSFIDAAKARFRSQSAISAQIHQLEEQLGVPLFHRTTRHVELTQEGKNLFEATQAALDIIDVSLREIYETANLHRGQVTLACSPTIAATRLPVVLRTFTEDYPALRVLVREENPPDLYESVRSGAVDFAIGPKLSTQEFDSEIILREQLFAAVPKSIVGTEQTSVTISELASSTLLLLNSASALRSQINDVFEARDLPMKTKHEFCQAQTLIAMASEGLGVAILPESVIPTTDLTNCRVLPIDAPALVREICLITRKGSSISPASRRLAQLARELIGSY